MPTALLSVTRRVVAQGFSQRPGVDFNKTFAPTTKWAALRVIFALAPLEDWELESVDISNTYLSGELKDIKVYMHQPEGFAEKDSTWVALKGLYGLKQGSQEWFKQLEEVLSQLGFSGIRADSSIFIWEKDGVQVICPVFVNNITFASKSKAKIAELKAAIAKHFKLRDLGPTTFQLGIEIICQRCASGGALRRAFRRTGVRSGEQRGRGVVRGSGRHIAGLPSRQ
jgi:hypothetical protein